MHKPMQLQKLINMFGNDLHWCCGEKIHKLSLQTVLAAQIDTVHGEGEIAPSTMSRRSAIRIGNILLSPNSWPNQVAGWIAPNAISPTSRPVPVLM
ncbi:MAG: hypothetical protein GPOALKHO_001610 [Sodalis sp.]|nr:MAG: hypothetical protein GPOALKHO_001610 [Sodalis sp.]